MNREQDIAKAAKKMFRRRIKLIIIGFVLVVSTAIQLHDQHVHKCMLNGPADRSTQRICNTFFPLHNHPIVPQEAP